MVRVLHILDHSLPLQSGYAFRTQAILRHQRERGWQTFHVTSPKHYLESPDEECQDGLKFYRTAGYGARVSKLPVVKDLAVIARLKSRLAKLVEEIRPEILHAHSPVLNAIPALMVGRRFGIPVLYEVRASWEDAAISHGTTKLNSLRYRLSRLLETFAVRRADEVTTICEGMRRDLIERGVSPERITVIPNAVDGSAFSGRGQPQGDLQRKFGLADKVVLGFIGSFYAYEGLGFLIQSFPQLLRTKPDLRILLVGGGPEEPALKDWVRKANLGDQVIFAERVEHGDVPAYYDLMDALIYPRLANRLTDLVTPLKPLEAMAQEKLVIASDVGGHRELITDGETGYLFKAEDSADLVATVLRALAEQDRWPETLARAKQFVERERSWDFSVGQYEAVYDRLVKAPVGLGSA